jgi:hypothetical protein
MTGPGLCWLLTFVTLPLAEEAREEPRQEPRMDHGVAGGSA